MQKIFPHSRDPKDPTEGLDPTLGPAVSFTSPAGGLEPTTIPHASLYWRSVLGRPKGHRGSLKVCIIGVNDLCQRLRDLPWSQEATLKVRTRVPQRGPQPSSVALRTQAPPMMRTAGFPSGSQRDKLLHQQPTVSPSSGSLCY